VLFNSLLRLPKIFSALSNPSLFFVFKSHYFCQLNCCALKTWVKLHINFTTSFKLGIFFLNLFLWFFYLLRFRHNLNLMCFLSSYFVFYDLCLVFGNIFIFFINRYLILNRLDWNFLNFHRAHILDWVDCVQFGCICFEITLLQLFFLRILNFTLFLFFLLLDLLLLTDDRLDL
jgi:hypothetical protein